MKCPSLKLHHPHYALKTPMVSFLFLEQGCSHTTVARTCQTAGRETEQRGPKALVGNGVTALGPVPGPLSLSRSWRQPCASHLTDCVKRGKSQELGAEFLQCGWLEIQDCRVQAGRAEAPCDTCHFLSTKFPVT